MDGLLGGVQTSMEAGDWVVIALYFLTVFAVGIWSSWSASRRGGIEGFFLAGRDMNFVLIGASLFASNIGSGHFVGLAGSGAKGGIAVAGFELGAIFILIMLGWLFVPVYIASGVYTMPEYLKRRFGGRRIRVYLSCLALLLYIFTKISADLFAGAIFINVALKGFGLYPAVLVLLAVACIFTIAGGLSAVIWTDAVQVVIMIIGSVVLMIMSFIRVGGYNEMIRKFFLAIPAANVTLSGLQCAGLPREDSMKLLRDASTADLPWSGMAFGLTINSIWYWCADQVIVQRTLAARNFTHAKAGCVLASWLKFLPLWLLVFPGMIARILYTDTVACTDPDECFKLCESRQGCSNAAYPMLVMDILPHGMRGLMLACMLSALMSSLTSIFSSSSTIFTVDIYPIFRPKATETEQVVVGRLFVLVLVVISVVWIPIIDVFQDAQLFNYIQAVTSFLAPPVCAVFVLGVFCPQANESGAFWGLMVGFVVGMIKFVLDIVFSEPACNATDDRPAIVAGVHYLHFAILLFFITLIVTLVLSAVTGSKPSRKQLDKLTFWSRKVGQKGGGAKVAPSAEKMEPVDSGPKGTDRSVSTLAYSASPGEEGKVEVRAGRAAAPSALHRALRLICCLSKTPSETQATQETVEDRMERMESSMSLAEDPLWKLITDISAIVVMAVAVFFWVFYA